MHLTSRENTSGPGCFQQTAKSDTTVWVCGGRGTALPWPHTPWAHSEAPKGSSAFSSHSHPTAPSTQWASEQVPLLHPLPPHSPPPLSQTPLKVGCPENIHPCKHLYAKVTAAYSRVPKWAQHKCPSPDERINKMWCIHTMEYYSVINQ